MKFLLLFFIPGSYQWQNRKYLMGASFAVMGLFFLILGCFPSLFVDNPDSSYDLLWSWLAHAPTKAGFTSWVGFNFYFLCCLSALGDGLLQSSQPCILNDSDKQSWKDVLSLWLSGQIIPAISKIETLLHKNYHDPWLHYLHARLLTTNKQFKEAKSALSKSQIRDRKKELIFERDQLSKILKENS